MIRWPDWLPNPQQDSYSYKPIDRRQKSDMEIGGIYRKEFDTDETECTCKIILHGIQSNFFEAFVNQVLSQGSIWFEFPLEIGGIIQYHSVRFKDQPQMSSTNGGNWQTYDLSLVVAKRILMQEDLVEIFMHYDPMKLLHISNRLHYILHYEIPPLTVPEWDEEWKYQLIDINNGLHKFLYIEIPNNLNIPKWEDY